MDIVENTLECPLEDVLERPLFCFFGTVSSDAAPRISPLWYLWEDERIWIIADTGKSYVDRVAADPRTALAVVDFDVATGRVHHVGMRGRADVVPFDEDRAERLLGRYLGPEENEWDPRFRGLDPDRWRFVRFEPGTVVARDQSFVPGLEPGDDA
ncbi:Pyridoxamine 5'-phosphate oxidase [Halobiforma haloterrestris]|uniref:Pyridoxamine 5'-phosphate oxidase n=1 Tax=Natronobacterium haloterrestre TaxID=148448 RepID=A0A1I1IJ40_NATHA|nr:pyridoxamine 5'-phosphate oxidase family protein [Halobiforma haloterrestris]SFC36257.1 Pyridoxamine 5'-phosphate oxidase [Halobiforma haloterrestris]